MRYRANMFLIHGGCELENLEGSPESCGYFKVFSCKLKSLKGITERLEGSLAVQNNELESLEFLPKYINGTLYVWGNPSGFTKKDIPKGCHITEGLNTDNYMDDVNGTIRT